MKSGKKFIFLSSIIMAASFVVTACGGGGGGDTPAPKGKFSFTPYFESGRSDVIYVGEPETLKVLEINTDETERTYTYSLENGYVEDPEHPGEYIEYPASDYVSVVQQGKDFKVTASNATVTESGEKFEIGIVIKETVSKVEKIAYVSIGERYAKANSGYNFSSNPAKKLEVLGKLEEYAMKKYLTGITLFENGGYVRYSPRVHLGTEPSTKYVTGYGFGVLTEGYLDNTWEPSINPDPVHPDRIKYLQQGTSSDPGDIAGWNAQDSQRSDLYSYITSSFWGTRLDEAKTHYEWYPVLAADDCLDPIPQDGKPTDTIHKKYRIYVKTNEIAYSYAPEANSDGTPKAGAVYHGRKVQLEDYLTSFQALLTGSCNLFRGSELAQDTSHGLKGAYSYFRKTKKASASDADTQWNSMQEVDEQGNRKLGISCGYDGTRPYLEFEFLNPIDVFTAKYTLSSNLYSPLPKEFLKKVGSGVTGDPNDWVSGASNFGTGSKLGDEGGTILNNTLCIGPFFLESWLGEQETFFKRNDTWFEYVNTKETDRPRYRIPGVHIRVYKSAQDHDDAIYNEFNLGHLDSTGIPVSRFNEKKSSDLKVEGDSTFKLNVNSLTQPKWDEIFWSNKKKYEKVSKPKERYMVKPWMSNIHFLNGLFYSIDRTKFADDRGVNPSVNYFSNAYMSDPVKGESYNDSVAHQLAQDAFDPNLATNLGYNTAKATAEFNRAVNELVDQGAFTLGTPSQPTTISIKISWMYSTDETTYGQEIANYFKAAFNNENVGSGCVRLNVEHGNDSSWEQVYTNHLQVGSFDLGFGAISGNTLDPLNFLEVLKSDNSSYFTLNWGADTSIVDEENPIYFEVEEPNPEDPEHPIKVNKEWSFDAAWAAADHGSIIQKGEAVDSVEFGYTEAPTKDGSKVNRLANGALMRIPFEFVKIDEGASFEVTRVELYLAGYGTLTIDSKRITEIFDEDNRLIAIVIDFDNTEVYETEPNPEDPEHPFEYTLSQWINKLMYDGLHNEQKKEGLDPVKDKDKIEDLDNPFSYNFYGEDSNWFIEVWYSITIEGSVPTESSYSVQLDKPTKFAFVK